MHGVRKLGLKTNKKETISFKNICKKKKKCSVILVI